MGGSVILFVVQEKAGQTPVLQETRVMRQKVWLTSSDYHKNVPRNLLDLCRGLLEANTKWNFELAPSPDLADIILFIENAEHKFRDYVDVLRSNEWIVKYPNRCFVHDFADFPAGFMPGVYTSMPRDRHDSRRTRAGAFMGINPFACTLGTNQPQLLFSFRGFASHPVRVELFKVKFDRPDCVVTQSFKWFNHDDSEKHRYGEELRNTKFVLCPRGAGTGTGRVFESMASGRVPIIMSDAYQPPMAPMWNDFAIILSESKVSQVAQIAEQYEPRWREMGQHGRHIYETWFCPEVNIFRLLQAIEEIMLYRPANHDEREYQAKWSGLKIAWENGWTLPQRGTRKIKQFLMPRTKEPRTK
jgi:hypothetical protein